MQYLCLQKGLWGILHGTLIGHLPNHDLQLGTLPTHLLLPALYGVTQAEMASHLPLIELLRAFLMRLAQDRQLTESGDTGDNHHDQAQPCVLKQFWKFIGIKLLLISDANSESSE